MRGAEAYSGRAEATKATSFSGTRPPLSWSLVVASPLLAPHRRIQNPTSEPSEIKDQNTKRNDTRETRKKLTFPEAWAREADSGLSFSVNQPG